MGSPRPWFLRLLLALALLAPPLAFAPVARATVMVSIPLEEMVRDASAIVHARVVRSGSRLIVDEAQPHTITELSVIEWLAGEGGAQIRIDEIGGSAGGAEMTIAGTPAYRVGDEVIVFLRSTPDGYRTMGMVQGQFVVRHGVPGTADVVVRDTSSVGFATWEGGPMSVVEGGRQTMQLDAFLEWIRTTASQMRVPASPSAVGGGL